MKRLLFVTLVLTSALAAGLARAGMEETINEILNQPDAPAGVVFQLATGDEDGLFRAIPIVRKYTEQLRKRFPALPIAVVSHSKELLALTRANAGTYKDIHTEVKSLTKNEGVDLHVCGGYAGRSGLEADAFPEYVDVAAFGPMKIRTYEDLGYIRVRVE